MDHAKLLNKVDHTLLAQGATWEEIRQICDDAIRFKTASVCIPPSYVKQAKGYVGDRMKICTVIGFPNGYNTTAVKEFEYETQSQTQIFTSVAFFPIVSVFKEAVVFPIINRSR